MTSTYAQRKALGDFGERLAARHLEAGGYAVLDRNWRSAEGEIDIVARLGACLVVVEVKTRTSVKFGTPVEAITPAKAARLHRLGGCWAAEHEVAFESLRVDVIAIVTRRRHRPELDHLVGVA